MSSKAGTFLTQNTQMFIFSNKVGQLGKPLQVMVKYCYGFYQQNGTLYNQLQKMSKNFLDEDENENDNHIWRIPLNSKEKKSGLWSEHGHYLLGWICAILKVPLNVEMVWHSADIFYCK